MIEAVERCPRCKKPTPPAELHTYEACEDCWNESRHAASNGSVIVALSNGPREGVGVTRYKGLTARQVAGRQHTS